MLQHSKGRMERRSYDHAYLVNYTRKLQTLLTLLQFIHTVLGNHSLSGNLISLANSLPHHTEIDMLLQPSNIPPFVRSLGLLRVAQLPLQLSYSTKSFGHSASQKRYLQTMVQSLYWMSSWQH